MAKKRSVKSRPVRRAASGSSSPAAARPPPAAPAGEAGSGAPAAMGIGGLQIPGLELEELQETVRNVVDYVQQNPVASVAVAFGCGVLLSAMYWEDQPVAGSGGGRSR